LNQPTTTPPVDQLTPRVNPQPKPGDIAPPGPKAQVDGTPKPDSLGGIEHGIKEIQQAIGGGHAKPGASIMKNLAQMTMRPPEIPNTVAGIPNLFRSVTSWLSGFSI